MIRHTVLMSFDGVEEALVQKVIDELREMPSLIPEIRSYIVGRDLGLSEGSAAIVVSGEFDTVADYQVYAGHAEHVRVITDHIRPHATGLTRAQIEI